MMDRLQRDAVLLTLLEQLQAQGSWCGETHIQKTTYFLQELLGVPLGFDFILYKHGPFSFDLSDEVTALQGDQLLSVVIRDPQYGPSLLPGPGVARFLARYLRTTKNYAGLIRFVAERLGRKNVAELEKLATALYVSRMPAVSSDLDARAEKISVLKPHIPIDQARIAVQTVDRMVEERKELTAP